VRLGEVRIARWLLERCGAPPCTGVSATNFEQAAAFPVPAVSPAVEFEATQRWNVERDQDVTRTLLKRAASDDPLCSTGSERSQSP
jgi:hypothetical protein